MFLFGPPGTGKTLLGKSIANEIEAKFIEITPTIIRGYPGDAEKRIEQIFSALDKEPRAVLFLDEAEWILGKREQQTSSVMPRITSTLLAQLTKLFKDRNRPIIVIAATNRPESVDTAYLRPERFDQKYYVGLPKFDARNQIIKNQFINRKNSLTESDIEEISNRLDGYSGADIVHIIDEAAHAAFDRRNENNAIINKEDLVNAIKRTSKSVRPEEIQTIERWAIERGIEI